MIPLQKTDYVVEGLGRLTGQYQGLPVISAWLTAALQQVQEIENVLWDCLIKRQLPNAQAAQLDDRGALVGQPRLFLNDADYKSIITLRLAVNRSKGRTSDWSRFTQILLSDAGGPAEYYEARDGFYLFVGFLHLNPIVVASVLRAAVANGIGPIVFGYSQWGDGGDFEWTSTFDATAGQRGYGSTYDASVGGLFVASVGIA